MAEQNPLVCGGRTAILEGSAGMRYERLPSPLVPHGEALIRVHEVGLCGSDARTYARRSSTRSRRILGHEIYGSVIGVSLDDRESNVVVGDNVAIIPTIECESCVECDAGMAQLCPNAVHIGAQRPGGLAELLVAPVKNLVPLPGSVPENLRVLVEPLAVAIHAAERVVDSRSRRCLILGAGAIGVLIAFVLREREAGHVVMADVSPMRLDLSAKLGFLDRAVVPPDGLSGRSHELPCSRPDVVFECVGSGDLAADALLYVRPGGTVVLVGSQRRGVSLSGRHAQAGERRVVGSFCYSRENFADAVDMLASDTLLRRSSLGAVMRRHQLPATEAVLSGMLAGDSPVLKEVISHVETTSGA